MAFSVAEPKRITVAKHDVVGASAALNGLVEVVAHRVIIGEALEVRDVALLDVIEAQRSRTFAGGDGRGRIIGAEIRRLLLAVSSRADGDFNPREELGVAAGRIFSGGIVAAAVELLPHLIKAVDRTCSVGVVGNAWGQLKWPSGKRANVKNARVRSRGVETRAASDQKLIIIRSKSILDSLADSDRRNEGNDGAAGKGNRKLVVGEFRLFGAEEERVGAAILGGELLRLLEIGAGCSVVVHNSFGEQIPYFLTAAGFVSCEDVIKAAIFSDDDDDMFNWSSRVTVFEVISMIFSVVVIMIIVCADHWGTDGELQKSNRRQTGANTMERVFAKVF